MRTRASIWVATGALLSACAAPYTRTAPEPLEHLPSLVGDYFPLRSSAMGTTYYIYVRYPEGYSKDPRRRYPIAYLLDGDSMFPMLAPEHLFLNYDDQIPDAIIVGIAYGSFAPPVNHREVDFGRRAADFERFLRTELIPRVEARVRADPTRRILVGQSFGASFVLYSAYDDPDLFWARIASNPSARMHAELLTQAPHATNREDLHLFLVSGTANNAQGRHFALVLSDRWSRGLAPWKFEEIDISGGTHAADLPNAYRLALRRLFRVAP